jgi:hypothetical protein
MGYEHFLTFGAALFTMTGNLEKEFFLHGADKENI